MNKSLQCCVIMDKDNENISSFCFFFLSLVIVIWECNFLSHRWGNSILIEIEVNYIWNFKIDIEWNGIYERKSIHDTSFKCVEKKNRLKNPEQKKNPWNYQSQC